MYVDGIHGGIAGELPILYEMTFAARKKVIGNQQWLQQNGVQKDSTDGNHGNENPRERKKR